MLVENQMVEVKWNGRTKKHYEEKGYKFSKINDIFLCKVEDLTSGSREKIKVKCDYCNKVIEREYYNHLAHRKRDLKNKIFKDACKKCTGKKTSENYGTEVFNVSETESPSPSKLYSEEFLIEEFYRYKSESGEYPRKIDMDGNKDFPSATAYYTRWGNWGNFLKSIGVVGDAGVYLEDEKVIKDMLPKEIYTIKEINDKLIEKRSIGEFIKLSKEFGIKPREMYVRRDYDKTQDSFILFSKSLKDLYFDIGKCPTATDYDAYTKLNSLPSRRLNEKRTGKKYNELCIEILQNSNNIIEKSKSKLIEELQELATKLGRTPNANDLVKNGLSTRKTYVKVFQKGFYDIVLESGLTPNKNTQRADHTQIDMLVGYSKLMEELNRTPTNLDVDQCEYLPSYKTLVNKFNGYNNMVNILGFSDDNLNQKGSAGKLSFNDRGEICKSIPELNISNILIRNKINYVSEPHYSDYDINIKKRWKMDWHLTDYKIHVEYFGFYNEKYLDKNNRTGKYSRKVKQKIKYCEENNIKIISIYPEDLKDNYKSVVDKFCEHGIDLNLNQLNTVI